jgi:hypothetical protein
MKRVSSFIVGAAVAALAIIAVPARPARAADADAALGAFGRPGSVILGVAGATASNQQVDDLAETTRSVAVGLTASTVFQGGWSLGASLSFGYDRTSVPSGVATTNAVAVEARGGRLTRLAPLVSWWPQLGVGYARSGASSTSPTVTIASGNTGGAALADIDAPIVLHPGAHFYIAAGPGLQARFAPDRQSLSLFGRLSFGWCL